MRDNEWPFGWTLLERAANKKSTSRVRFDPERVATFLLRLSSPRRQVFDDKEKLIGPITTRVENSRGFSRRGSVIAGPSYPGEEIFRELVEIHGQ